MLVFGFHIVTMINPCVFILYRQTHTVSVIAPGLFSNHFKSEKTFDTF